MDQVRERRHIKAVSGMQPQESRAHLTSIRKLACDAEPALGSRIMALPAIANIGYFFSVFCFFQFLPIAAEVQPFAVLFCALGLAISRVRVGVAHASIIFSLLLSALVGVFNVYEGAVSVFAFLSSAAALTFGLVVFAFFMRAGGPSRALNQPVLFFLAGFALIQVFAPGVLESTGASGVIQRFIPRFSSEILAEWDRGVTLLAPEPANMAPIIFMIACVFALEAEDKSLSWQRRLFMITAIVVLIVTNKSLTMYLIVFLFSLVYVLFRYGLAVVFLGGGAIVALLVWGGDLSSSQLGGGRLATFTTLLTNFSSDSILLLDNLTGSRFSTLAVAYTGFSHLGFGLGSWDFRFLELASQFNYDIFAAESWRLRGGAENIKPASIFAVAAIDMGVIGLVYVAAVSVLLIRGFRRIERSSPLRRSVAITSLLMIAIGGTPITLPAFWVVLGIAASQPRVA